MIGSGMPNNHNNAPFPKPMALLLCSHANNSCDFKNCSDAVGTRSCSPPLQQTGRQGALCFPVLYSTGGYMRIFHQLVRSYLVSLRAASFTSPTALWTAQGSRTVVYLLTTRTRDQLGTFS